MALSFIRPLNVFLFQSFVCFPFVPLYNRKNLPVGTRLEPDGLTETDGSPKSHPLSGWRSNKNSALSDERELQNLLQKLSGHSLETPDISGLGDTDSLSSYTSGCNSVVDLHP